MRNYLAVCQSNILVKLQRLLLQVPEPLYCLSLIHYSYTPIIWIWLCLPMNCMQKKRTWLYLGVCDDKLLWKSNVSFTLKAKNTHCFYYELCKMCVFSRKQRLVCSIPFPPPRFCPVYSWALWPIHILPGTLTNDTLCASMLQMAKCTWTSILLTPSVQLPN